MTPMNSSLTRPVVRGVALSLLLAGVLLVGCSKEEKDPDIVIVQPNAGNTSSGGTGGASGGAAAGGAAAGGDAGASAGGDAGAGGGNGCPAAGQVPNAMTGECACPGFKPDLCETAMVCVKLTDDLEHCGTCDNACPATAACNAGVCTPVPTEVATITDCSSTRMALGTGMLYLTDSGTGRIVSVATAPGSTPTDLVSAEVMPSSIAVDADAVYWTTGDLSTTPPGPGAIRTVPLAGGTAATLVDLDTPSRGIAVTGGMVFFTHVNDLFKIATTPAAADAGAGTAPSAYMCTEEDTLLGRVPLPLGDPVAGATYVASCNESCSEGGLPNAIAVSATRMLYVIDVRSGVENNSINGGDYVEMGESQGSLMLNTAAIEGNYGYWAAGDHVQRAPMDVGKTMQEQVAASLGFQVVTGFSMTATHAYIADEDGIIQRAALAGIGPTQEAEPLATAQEGAHSLVNDGTNLYWINTDCKIMTIALPP